MEKKKEYIKYNKDTKEYSILLEYSPNDIMDGYYYYRVGKFSELDELIKGSIENALSERKADYNNNTIKWFREFFTYDDLVETFNEEIYKIIYDTDEDFVERMERRIELHDNDITDYSNPNEKPVNWR